MIKNNPESTWVAKIDMCTPVKANTKVILPSVWANTDKGQTDTKNIQIILSEESTLKDALIAVENAATEFVRSQGASEIRRYFIENVIIENDKVEFIWGT
ncbi:MAG: hypothetical protein U9N57_01140 [Pseudomonadota bacterium]|nr:hypothetical protein [Pseudomonadota bacterium]